MDSTTSTLSWEVGTVVTAWTQKNFLAGVKTDVTLAGAVSLTAAAGAIVFALLF